MNAIYVCGDTHWGNGDEQKLLKLKADASDIVIVCGDFGALWNESSNAVLDVIEKWIPYTICFVDGNHENFEMIYSYPLEEWNGGKIHRIRKNIIHMCRGELFTIHNKTFFTFGGGYSIDKAMRTEHISWWKEELPTIEEYEHGKNTLKDLAHVNIVLTHAGPKEIVDYFFVKKGYKLFLTPEEELKQYFQDISTMITFDHWFFGHYHFDESAKNFTCMYHKMYKIG